MLGQKRSRPDDVDVESCLANLDRLNAVNATGLMKAPPRAEFDDLAERAADRLRTPMAFLNVLDEKHLRVAGAAGITGELAQTRQKPVEESYCQHVVAFDDVFVVDNALDDALVAKNAGTTTDGVRAYLGVPIRKDGQCIGSFCVVDTKPRRWTDKNLHELEQLADLVMQEIDS